MLKCYKKENYADDAWADYLVVDSDRIFGFDYFGEFDAWTAQDDIDNVKLQIEDSNHYQLCSNKEILEQKAAWQLPPTVIAALKMEWK